MRNDPKATYSGFSAISQGVSSAVASIALPASQLSWLVNGTTRNGYPECRPGWSSLALQFLAADGTTDTALRDLFEDGCWQGAHPYTDTQGNSHLIVCISGRVFKIDTSDRKVTDLSGVSGQVNPSDRPQVWMVQAEEFLIIQDGSSIPLIFNGATLRRSIPRINGGNEIPVGTVMCYNGGRIWVASEDRRTFIAGDLAYSLTQSTADVLSFTENTFLNGGGAFVVPSQSGRITAMQSVAVQDTTTAQGPLQVFTERGVLSVNAPFDRDIWQNLQSPIQTISVLAAGASGQSSTINVNGDIWYRANDGIRSFAVARRDHGTWVNTPLSEEVSRALGGDNESLLGFGSSALFDNRLLQTVSPYTYKTNNEDRGVAHRGLVALDFNPVSRMFDRSQPVWEGVWTGLQVLQVVYHPTVDRCFLFAIDTDGDIELWELSKNDKFDSYDNPIEWVIETPSYGFADQGFGEKLLRTADLWYDRLTGQVDFTSKFRPDDDPMWQTHHTWQEHAAYRDCNLATCNVPANYLEQYRSRVRLPEFANTCDSVANKPHNRGFAFAMRFEITGYARIKRLLLGARSVPEDVAGACPSSTQAAVSYTGCPPSDYSYTTLK